MEPDDIIISRTGRRRPAYIVKTAASPGQILFRRYVDALARARCVAARARVDVWIVDGDQGLALIARHRFVR